MAEVQDLGAWKPDALASKVYLPAHTTLWEGVLQIQNPLRVCLSERQANGCTQEMCTCLGAMFGGCPGHYARAHKKVWCTWDICRMCEPAITSAMIMVINNADEQS